MDKETLPLIPEDEETDRSVRIAKKTGLTIRLATKSSPKPQSPEDQQAIRIYKRLRLMSMIGKRIREDQKNK